MEIKLNNSTENGSESRNAGYLYPVNENETVLELVTEWSGELFLHKPFHEESTLRVWIDDEAGHLNLDFGRDGEREDEYELLTEEELEELECKVVRFTKDDKKGTKVLAMSILGLEYVFNWRVTKSSGIPNISIFNPPKKKEYVHKRTGRRPGK